MKNSPPKYALRFLRWFCRPDYLEEIEGDLLELFEKQVEQTPRKANWNFRWQVLRHFRPDFIRSFNHYSLINGAMYRNYFKTAWRNLLKQRLYSMINLSGLTVGMACFILIAFYVQYELSYDTSHEKADQIYRVIQQQEGNAFRGTDFFAVTPEPLGPALLESFPEVEATATVTDPRYASEKVILSYEEKVFSPRILYADADIFDVFTIPVLDGAGGAALEDPNSILLSRSLARKYFGDESALGKHLVFNNERPLTVKGVFEDRPENQHLVFDYLVSIKNYDQYQFDVGRWGSNNYRTYLVLRQGHDYKALEQKFAVFDDEIEAAYGNAPFRAEFFLQPVQDIYLHSVANFESASVSDIRYIYLFVSIAFIILLLAAVNYMNLTTARSFSRSREVGVRKVLGARRSQLISQLLGESFLLTLISFVLALSLVFMILPLFNNLIGRPIPFDIVGSRWFLIAMFLTAISIGGLSGLYPAFFLSAVTTVQAIKGNFLKRFGRGVFIRNSLIIGQFATAVVLAVSSLVVYQQLQYVQNKKLGFNRDQVAYVPFYFKMVEDNYELIRRDLLMHPQIEKVAISTALPINTDNQGLVNRWEGNDGERNIYCYRHQVDYHFLDLFEIDLLEGRNFSLEHSTDSTSSYILNESAVAAIGWTPTSALGKGFRNGQVIGVVKDFHFQPMDLNIEPMYMMLRSPQNTYGNYGNISIKIKMDDVAGTLAHIEQSFQKFAPNLPFESHFLDESYNQQYETERRLGNAFNIFTILALFIASVGLFGLVSHIVVIRTKEIGVRKVLGASVTSIVKLLSKDFLWLVVISILVAVPIAWYLMRHWLQGFAYRIDMPWWAFGCAALTTLVVSLLTVGWQSARAAIANPVDSLRDE